MSGNGRVVEVVSKSDIIIMVKVVLEDKVLNGVIIKHVGCEENQKEEFWWKIYEVIQGIPGRR